MEARAWVERRLDRRAADHLAHHALGRGLHRVGRVARVEEIVGRVADMPEHAEIDVDDVLVAGEHQALGRHVPRGGAARRGLARVGRAAIADIDAVHAGDGGKIDRLDGPGQVVVEPGRGEAGEGAEAEHHALLVGLDAVEAGGEPDRDHGDGEQREAPPPGRAARHEAAQPGLEPGDELIEIVGRRRAVAPWRPGRRPGRRPGDSGRCRPGRGGVSSPQGFWPGLSPGGPLLPPLLPPLFQGMRCGSSLYDALRTEAARRRVHRTASPGNSSG